MSSVEQSGTITVGHLASWVSSGVIGDAGVTFFNTYGEFVSTGLQLDFSTSNTDHPIPIYLPSGYTRYRVNKILISGATVNISPATCRVLTGQNGTGTVIVGVTAITITQTSADTVNNMQSLTINNQDTMALSDGVLYFRVQTAINVAGYATVSIFYSPLP